MEKSDDIHFKGVGVLKKGGNSLKILRRHKEVIHSTSLTFLLYLFASSISVYWKGGEASS